MVKNLTDALWVQPESFLHSENQGFSDYYFCEQKQYDNNFIIAEKKSW